MDNLTPARGQEANVAVLSFTWERESEHGQREFI